MIMPPEVKLKRLATQPCSKLPGMENFVPYVAMDWDESKISWASVDNSPTANTGRYNHDPITQKVYRKGEGPKRKRAAKKPKPTECDPVPFDDIDWGSLTVPSDDDIAPLVAALPSDRMNMKAAGKWLESNKPNEAQWALIVAITPMAKRLALTVGSKRGRYKFDDDDATDITTQYLERAVVANPTDRKDSGGEPITPLKWIIGRIRNGLKTKKDTEGEQRKQVKTDSRVVGNVTGENEVFMPEEGFDRMNDLVESKPVRRVDCALDKTPIDPADKAAVEADREARDKAYRKIIKKHRLKDKKEVDPIDVVLQQYEKLRAPTPFARNIWMMVCNDTPTDQIADELRLTRHEVLEIMRDLADSARLAA